MNIDDFISKIQLRRLEENVKEDHLNQILENNEAKHFFCMVGNESGIGKHMEFNHDYYNKWKLKNKIDNF